MSDWFVFCRSVIHGGDEARSPASPSREAVIIHARNLLRQHNDVFRIEGPNGEVISRDDIDHWVAANRE
jgi:hypothetical protein